MFGYSEEQIAQFGLTFGVSAFMLYMVFIIFQLARESKAGRFGTFVLLSTFGLYVVITSIKGSRNAAVFPVPVCAQAIRSRPSNTAGMACC